jgi:hypothetical protein
MTSIKENILAVLVAVLMVGYVCLSLSEFHAVRDAEAERCIENHGFPVLGKHLSVVCVQEK